MERDRQQEKGAANPTHHPDTRDPILPAQSFVNQPEPRNPHRASPPLVVIAGPTGTGKSAAAVALASQFGGEVVNADSRYLYRGFDIGVAKPTHAERGNIPHHLIDIIGPTELMSLAIYQDLAMAALDAVLQRNGLPFLVGGTPLYVNAVVEGWHIPRVPPNPKFRAALEAEAARDGVDILAQRLAAVDPITAARSGSNARRIIRALEVFAVTGQPLSSLEGKGPPPYRALEIGLTMPRDQLHARVDVRVDHLIARGLVEEVKELLAAGVSPNAPAMASIGYRQLLPYLSGASSLDEAIERIKIDTHRYIRHQETWFRKNPRLINLDVTRAGWLGEAADLIERHLTKRGLVSTKEPTDDI
ncbi:MAG TPA: tRNA (adenosine(37)-N6)-dimethylallyltransferase MiaA [Thermomicrobiales bacterium]|nr:tRNA (adenosine(37)-N6)-dimethylallyltransferase MiaA [Thermomicrobiales bacterium]